LLKLFRRKKESGQAPSEAAAPQTPETAQPQAGGATGSPAQPQARPRRRGTRGGRGRKKTTTQAGAEKAEPKAAEAKPEKKSEKAARGREQAKPERRPARQRAQPRRRVAPKRAPLPKAKRELVISVDVGEKRVAVLEDGQVAEVYLERPERRSIAGNIYLGVVDNVLPGMEAAFVEIGLEKNGFLYVDEIVVPELEGKARQGKRIQDLIQRGQTILVQAVKDPMKTKGARLTTEISLPGRFVVFVPQGEGLGVSRRLPDDERTRLKDILKALNVKDGGVIVRTAAEGASAEDVERDLVFLQRLWKTIQERAKASQAPTLVYQEAELPLRVVRDLFTGDFERALIDHDRTFKRVVGYLKKTSPHMVERVVRHKEREPLMEAYGIEEQIRSTLSRRVDLPSGGYLIFDYAEAFTVIDVNTGRFVGSRSKTSGGRLEDTITKNNLEAVKEVVRQLRLRDIGGIIVIDFIDMANPKNRATVEEALRTELERDRTKTYVVEISPLGLVEMTRQNVTEGPREILTKRCPTCSGDGVLLSETSVAMDIERRLRSLVAPGSRTQAYRVELHPRIASLLIGPGGSRLAEIEEAARRRFFLSPTENGHGLDHFAVLAEGKLEDVRPQAPIEEGKELELKLVEVGRWDAESGVGKVDGYDVCVADAAKLVGKKVKVRVERVLDGTAYAVRLDAAPAVEGPLTAELEAEKPTRAPSRVKKPDAAAVEALPDEEAEDLDVEPAEELDDAAEAEKQAEGETAAAARKRTRRGTRGGRRRKKKPAEAGAGALAAEPAADEEPAEQPAGRAPRIHVPATEPEEEPAEAEAAAAEAAPSSGQAARKRTRRGTRGGRGRKKKTPADAAAEDGRPEVEAEAEAGSKPEAEPVTAREPEPKPQTDERDEDWGYVPMSEWDTWEDERARSV